MKGTTKIRLAIGCLAIAVLLLLCLSFVVCNEISGPWLTQARRVQSDNNMHLLAAGTEAYRADFGRYPNRLAELAPKYVPIDKGFYRCVRMTQPPKDLEMIPEVIDAFLPYCFIPLKRGGYVIAERQGTWPDGTLGFVLSGEPADDYSSGTRSPHHRVKTEEFMRLLAEGFASAK